MSSATTTDSATANANPGAPSQQHAPVVGRVPALSLRAPYFRAALDRLANDVARRQQTGERINEVVLEGVRLQNELLAMGTRFQPAALDKLTLVRRKFTAANTGLQFLVVEASGQQANSAVSEVVTARLVDDLRRVRANEVVLDDRGELRRYRARLRGRNWRLRRR
jgi:hypothetical protein